MKEQGVSQEVVEYINSQFDQRAEYFLHQIEQAMDNLHVELIRNFTIQENELRESLENVVNQNKLRRKELKYLREENQKLRNISY